MAEFQIIVRDKGFTKALIFMDRTFEIHYKKNDRGKFDSDGVPIPTQVQEALPNMPPYVSFKLIHDLSFKSLSTSNRMKIVRELTDYEEKYNEKKSGGE